MGILNGINQVTPKIPKTRDLKVFGELHKSLVASKEGNGMPSFKISPFECKLGSYEKRRVLTHCFLSL